MGKLSIYEPAAGTNLVPNPSFEGSVYPWASSGSGSSGLEPSYNCAVHGTSALLLTTDPVGSDCGAFVRCAVSPSTGYVANIWLRADTPLTLQLNLSRYTSGDSFIAESTVDCSVTTTWTLFTRTCTTESNAAFVRLIVRKMGTGTTVSWYMDGAQLEVGASPTTFIDGDQPGCSWNGVAHASTSSRSSQYRGGGVLRDLDTYCGVRTVALVGIGAMPHEVQARPYSTVPGGVVDGYRLDAREITFILVIHTTNLAALHAIRKKLSALFLPGRVYPPNQPLRLRYTGASTTLELEAYYKEGLEFDVQARHMPNDRLAITLHCPDPYYREVGLTTHVRTTGSTKLAGVNSFVTNASGSWANVREFLPTTAQVNCAYRLTQGWLIGGLFTNLNSVTNATNLAFISNDGATSAVGSGTNGEVQRIVKQPFNSEFYVVGAFTTANGVSHPRAFRLSYTTATPPAWTFTAMHSGVDSGTVYGACLAPPGSGYAGDDLFLAGDFTGCSSVTNTGYMVWYDRSANQYKSIHSGVGAGDGATLAYDVSFYWNGQNSPRGLLFGGLFASVSGVTARNLALLKLDASGWAAFGNVLPTSAPIKAVHVEGAQPGRCVVGGSGVTSIGGVACANVALHYQGAWSAMGPGLNKPGADLAIQRITNDEPGGGVGGNFWALGSFDDGGSYSVGGLDGAAYWDGSWHNNSLSLASGDKARDIVFSGGDRYLCLKGESASWASASATITNNGTSPTRPHFVFPWVAGASVAPHVTSIVNETTGQAILLNHNLVSGEVYHVDLDYKADPLQEPTAGRVRVWSSIDGDLPGDIQAGSDLADFALIPGANRLTFYVSEDISATTAPTVLIQYALTHDTADI